MGNNADGSAAEQCVFDSVPYQASESRVYDCPLTGQYVRIGFPPNRKNFLQLCEVQVEGEKGMLKS